MTMIILSSMFLLILFSFIEITLSDIYVYNNGNKLVEDFDDQSANFGPSFPTDGLKGYLKLTNPRNACTRVESAPVISTPGFRWIALIPRTKSNESCDFDLKVLNAQNANFSAVIIYNYEDTLIPMEPHGRDIHIPSTLITLSDGLSLISHYVFNQTVSNSSKPAYYVKVDDDQLFKMSAYVIPLVAVIGLSFLALVGFMVIKCCLHRRRTRRHRLPRSALKQLKTKKFVKGDRWEVCAICLDDYEEGAKLRILPCDHAYHMKCIDPWLLNNRRQCPVCKRYVFPNQDHSDEEDNTAHTATERTPLLQNTNEATTEIPPNSRPRGRRRDNPSSAGVSNISYANDETSDTDDELLSTSTPTSTNNPTTTGLVVDGSSSFSESYSHPQLPRVILRQSSPRDDDTEDSTMYRSVYDSLTNSFSTSRAANFFVGSLGGTTDNTNLSARSVIEDTSDVDTTFNDEPMHSVLTDVELNPESVSQSETTNNAHVNL